MLLKMLKMPYDGIRTIAKWKEDAILLARQSFFRFQETSIFTCPWQEIWTTEKSTLLCNLQVVKLPCCWKHTFPVVYSRIQLDGAAVFLHKEGRGSGLL